MIVAPSFLSSDFLKLKDEILSINQAKWLHFDVMDGKFVSNETYNHRMLKKVGEYSDQVFDCHLMIEEPEKFIENYAVSGAHIITFHYEATDDANSVIKTIKSYNVKAGISIKPETDVSVLKDLLKDLDLVLIMSVEPGEGGQSFLPSALDKIEYLNKIRSDFKLDFLIEVDGGINLETAKKVKEAGADVIVAGSYIFKQKNRNKVIKELENVW